MSDVAISISTGIVASITLILVFYFYDRTKYWYRYKKYEGKYISRLKNPPHTEHYYLELTRDENKFIINGNSLLGDKDPIEGEIEMSPSLKNHGRGFYYHKVAGQKRKFGFYEIQLTSDDILVHQDIKNLKKDEAGKQIEIGEDCSASYVWTKSKL